jgi:AraC-like DNA-binding protein
VRPNVERPGSPNEGRIERLAGILPSANDYELMSVTDRECRFRQWLSAPFDDQCRAMEHYLRNGQGRWPADGLESSCDLFERIVPGTMPPSDRVLFRIQIGAVLTVVQGAASTLPPLVIELLKIARIDSAQQHPSLRRLSLMYQVSPRRLGRVFRESFGVSFSRYVLAMRMCKAASALRSSGVLLKQLVVELGYGDIGNFSRDFRKVYGVNVREFRRSIADARCPGGGQEGRRQNARNRVRGSGFSH